MKRKVRVIDTEKVNLMSEWCDYIENGGIGSPMQYRNNEIESGRMIVINNQLCWASED